MNVLRRGRSRKSLQNGLHPVIKAAREFRAGRIGNAVASIRYHRLHRRRRFKSAAKGQISDALTDEYDGRHGFADKQRVPLRLGPVSGRKFDKTSKLCAQRFAEFETNLRRERQLEGIAKAKAAGVYRGRKPSIDQAQVEKLKADGLGATEIAKRLNIGRASVYRVLAS